MKEIRNSNIVPSKEEMTLEGVPIVFDKPTKINDIFGSYTEIIKSCAISSKQLEDVKLLYNHDLNSIPLARSQKTMKLTKDNEGIKMVATLDETNKSIYASIKRGDLTGMSFSFTVPPGGDEFNKDTNTRTINKIDKIYEVSVVPFPAYEQTSVQARAKENKQELLIKINKILTKEI